MVPCLAPKFHCRQADVFYSAVGRESVYVKGSLWDRNSMMTDTRKGEFTKVNETITLVRHLSHVYIIDDG